MRQFYDTWLADRTVHEFTKGGNMKPPSCALICEWVKVSWDAISEDMVEASFLCCAVTTSTDGSNDGSIHCFKEHQPCAEGKELLDKEMEKLRKKASNTENISADDPFASDDDVSETENNEVCIDESDDDLNESDDKDDYDDLIENDYEDDYDEEDNENS